MYGAVAFFEGTTAAFVLIPSTSVFALICLIIVGPVDPADLLKFRGYDRLVLIVWRGICDGDVDDSLGQSVSDLADGDLDREDDSFS